MRCLTEQKRLDGRSASETGSADRLNWPQQTWKQPVSLSLWNSHKSHKHKMRALPVWVHQGYVCCLHTYVPTMVSQNHRCLYTSVPNSLDGPSDQNCLAELRNEDPGQPATTTLDIEHQLASPTSEFLAGPQDHCKNAPRFVCVGKSCANHLSWKVIWTILIM